MLPIDCLQPALRRHTVCLALAVAGLLLAGCATDTFVDNERARRLAARSYPEQAERAPDLDILVRRRGGQINVINRSARRLEDMQFWINRQYVREIDAIEIGTDNRFALGKFINRYQEAFPTAGLLTPDRTEPVTSAELYDPDARQRYRLVVMPEHRDRLGED